MPDRATAGAVHDHGLPLFLSRKGTLSPREAQTLELVAQGYSAAEIAGRLHLASRTVERYLQGAYNKLGARNAPNAVAIALSRQLIKFDALTVN